MESALISPPALTEEAGIGQPDSVKSTFITLVVVFVSFKQGYWLNNELPIVRNTSGTPVMLSKNRVCAIAARETEGIIRVLSHKKVWNRSSVQSGSNNVH